MNIYEFSAKLAKELKENEDNIIEIECNYSWGANEPHLSESALTEFILSFLENNDTVIYK